MGISRSITLRNGKSINTGNQIASLANIERKFKDYLDKFPIDIIFRAKLIASEGHTRDNSMYFGPVFGSMRHGSYGICFQKEIN